MNSHNYTFAKFWKCALQINSHSYSGNYRGAPHCMDPKRYAEALRDTCLAENIQVVGLADHGSVEDAESIRKVLVEAGIVVFPGFEVATTEKVHWVCLFPEDTSVNSLEHFQRMLSSTDVGDRVKPSNLSGKDLLWKVEELKGFCFAAHVTSNNGLLKKKFDNLWKENKLLAAQIPGRVDDLPFNYKQIILGKDPNYLRDRPVALINAKDVANPEDLSELRASTFIKMTRPCFASFLTAFKDPESRVRLCDDLRERNYSQIDSISIDGGYFNDLSAQVSGHLNAVIGGRGTGKSTFLECVRYALDVPHKGKDAIDQGDRIINENLGRTRGRVVLKLRSAKNHMNSYEVVRRFGEPPRVIDQNGDVSLLHPGRDLLPGIEIYGQNEIYELARSPGALARVLDRFLTNDVELQPRLESVYRKLKQNSDQLNKALEQKDEIESEIAQLPKLEEQVRQFKEKNLDEKLKQVPLLERERQLGPRVLEEIDNVRTGKLQLEESLPDLIFLSEKALQDLPHADLLRSGRQLLERLDTVLHKIIAEIDQIVEETGTELVNVVRKINDALKLSESQLEKEFSELPVVAGKERREVGRTYQNLLREIERVKPSKTRLNNVETLIKDLEQERRNLLVEISSIRSKRTAVKRDAVKRLNQRLSGKLRITLKPDGIREPLREFLQELPGVGERKTQWVDGNEDLTVLGLVDAIHAGKDALKDKGWGLTTGVAMTLTQMTSEQVFSLESIDLEDRIDIELNISHNGEIYRALDRLSTGQQCTAILHLLLLDNPDPLIMDQPEDNLDNAFIAERIVHELRTSKTERQFLFATHNANIPVFGDAEWIGICSASGSCAEMPVEAQGSIDIPVIRDQVANLLEGGKEAFMQRKEKYGFEY